MSATATSWTLESAFSAFLAAPVPRPPQPIRPILSALFSPAKSDGARARPPARVEAARKSRRVVVGSGLMRTDSGERRGRWEGLLSSDGRALAPGKAAFGPGGTVSFHPPVAAAPAI